MSLLDLFRKNKKTSEENTVYKNQVDDLKPPPNQKSLSREQILDSWSKTNFGSEEKNLIRDKHISDIRELNLDYICVENRPCCEKCAPFVKRYYNLSGKDSRFPKLPNFFLSAENVNHCDINFYPVDRVIIDTFIETQDRGDIVAISNRPFVDDRNEREINAYRYDKYVWKVNSAVNRKDKYSVNFDSGLDSNGDYDFTVLTEDERNYVQVTIDYANSLYDEKHVAIGIMHISKLAVLKPSYIINYYVMLKYADSDNPLDIVAVAVAYSKMGAQYRSQAIMYLKKYFENSCDLSIPDSDGYFFDEPFLHKQLALLYEKEYQLQEAVSEWEKAIKQYKPTYDSVVGLCEVLSKIDINLAVERYKEYLSSSELSENDKVFLESPMRKAIEKQEKGYVYKARKSKIKEKDILKGKQIEELAKQFI